MAALVTGKYITSDDLSNRITADTFAQIFDDDNSGDPSLFNVASIRQVIESAEGEVDGFLITTRKLPLAATTNPTLDRLLKLCCVDFAQALAYEIHPEYVRTYGDKSSKDSPIWQRATNRMLRIKAGMQELPDQDQQNGKPINIGGVVYDQGPRTMVDGSDGTENGGDL